jgi:hypothetical protein
VQSTGPNQCPAEALLERWAETARAGWLDTCEQRHQIEDEATQVVAKSDVGAAFQLLLAFTSDPWGRADTPEFSDELMDQMTDGVDWQRRLMVGAYLHMTRDIASVDLRLAERHMTAENVDGRGILGWLKDAQSTVDFRAAL